MRADVQLKRDWLDVDYSLIGGSTGTGEARTTGLAVEAGYLVLNQPGLAVELIGNLSHSETQVNGVAFGANALQVEASRTTRGAIGVSVSSTQMLGDVRLKPSATVKYWTVLDSAQRSTIAGTLWGQGAPENQVEASATLDFESPDGWTGFVSGGGLFGNGADGLRVEAGLKMTW